ncbi:hypothetical protein RJ639_041602 [Escallonia herrerae]|uniref:Chitinase domain-containing protein 1 n=1 Tax=Escallonia herrerae TaxID=1293975 RepID=A0AA89B6Q4_9ASTE|nr:hypothetical protein RJ639_041602 [Escallonia herrerae]
MANRRDRRAGLGSVRRANRVHPSSSDHQTTDSAQSHATRGRRLAATIFAITFVASSAISAIVYRIRYAPSADPTTPPYVYQRGLVKTDVNYREILTEYAKVSDSNASERHYKYPLRSAYTITVIALNCFHMLGNFGCSQGTKLVLEGRHNADTGWISELRMKGDVQLLPRVVLEAVPVDLLKKKKKRDKAINLIIEECKEMEYDGVVLESWSRWAAYGVLHDPDLRNMALQFVKQLGQAMHSVRLEKNGKQNLQLVYVIGPPRSEKFQEHDFGPEDLQSLSDAVDGYSLMTYDFSSPQNPGPNAPLRWIHSTLQLLLDTSNGAAQSLPQKIFVGINFYGNDFVLSGGLGGGPIVGREYLSLLEQHRPLFQWEKNSAEHFFLYSDDQNVKHVVFYPSLMSIAARLEEASLWGAGISIWEIGQDQADD